jgi:glycosyltransferase involved in cell wall biosynthesis
MSLTLSLTLSQLAVVIPARNEAASIRAVAEACLKYSSRVIVVDDASTDDTAAALHGVAVQLLRSETQLGKGGALQLGFAAAMQAGAAAVITLDGDGQHDAADIPAFVAAANRYPHHLIVGARLRQMHNAPRRRLIANRIADFFISWAAGQAVRDTQCGQRLYPAALLHAVTLQSRPIDGFVFESEILIDAVRKGFSAVSVPIEARYPPHARASHFKPARDIWRITRMVSRKVVPRGMYLHGLVRSLMQKPVVVEPTFRRFE